MDFTMWKAVDIAIQHEFTHTQVHVCFKNLNIRII
jgi:hypothetical protein